MQEVDHINCIIPIYLFKKNLMMKNKKKYKARISWNCHTTILLMFINNDIQL